jgi:hypothetical protein
VHSELRDCILGLYQEMRHKQELHFELHKRARELHHVLSVLRIELRWEILLGSAFGWRSAPQAL